MFTKTTLIYALLTISLLATAGCSSEDKKSDEFMKKSAQDAIAEQQLGKFILERGTNPAVKQFAQQMISDHSQESKDLAAWAAKKSVALPTEPSSKQKEKIAELQKKSGAELDKDYIEYMVKDHKEDVDSFTKQAQEGTDAEIKAFAAKTVPVLKHHLEMAQTISGKS